MFAWFLKNMNDPFLVIHRFFKNPRCNLSQFWRPGGLFFKQCKANNPICKEPGLLVTDDPDDSLLFPKNHPRHPEVMFEFKNFTVRIGDQKSSKDACLYGPKKYQGKTMIVRPKLISGSVGNVRYIKA